MHEVHEYEASNKIQVPRDSLLNRLQADEKQLHEFISDLEQKLIPILSQNEMPDDMLREAYPMNSPLADVANGIENAIERIARIIRKVEV